MDETELTQQELSAFQPGGRFGLHGMLAFGGPGTHYLSHVPMFHAPHDVQAIFQVTFDPPVQALSSTLYTLKPQTMSLDDLVLRRASTFDATLYHGSFEAGGDHLTRVKVRVERVLHARVLKPSALQLPEPHYFVFGSQEQVFLVHQIFAPPGFDQLLVGRPINGADFPAAALASGITLRAMGHSDTVEDRLRSGMTIYANAPRSPPGVDVRVDLELSALLGPDFVNIAR
ncbi:MAG: hypothetical protein ACT4TC_19795 [Myxococcaceae bacterium]